MNKILLLLLLTSVIKTYSQDIILKTNGTSIESKIDEIGTDKIKYHKYNNLSGPVFILQKENVSKITFENGDVEEFDIKGKSKLEEEKLKEYIVDNINKHGFEKDSDKKAYRASFEGDYLRLIVLNKKGEESNEGYLYDFTTVYKFSGVDKRKDELAYINVWISKSKNEKKNKWEKDKLVMRVKGHKNADRIMRAFKEYSDLLLLRD